VIGLAPRSGVGGKRVKSNPQSIINPIMPLGNFFLSLLGPVLDFKFNREKLDRSKQIGTGNILF
jgi:hypothetical protein